jgi:hypothetical protein
MLKAEESTADASTACEPRRPLTGLQVAVLTSGHQAMDHRVYHKVAVGVHSLGAEVFVVGRHSIAASDETGPVPVRPLPAPRSRLERFLVQPWRCLWAARGQRLDIVHIHDAELLLTLPLARLLFREAKFVYDVHEDFSKLLGIRDWLPQRLKPVVQAVVDRAERALAGLAHGIVAVTPPLAERFSHRNRTATYNFPSRDYYERAGKAMRPVGQREYDLVHLGSVSRERAEFLAAILQAVHRQRPESRTLVIGVSGEIAASLKATCPAGCDVVETVPYSRVPALLGNARVGLSLHPRLKPHLLPALPVKVFEYIGAGCGVVASSMPILDQVRLERGVASVLLQLLRSENPEDYAESAIAMLDTMAAPAGADPTLRAAARNCMTWEGEVPKIGELYLELRGGR